MLCAVLSGQREEGESEGRVGWGVLSPLWAARAEFGPALVLQWAFWPAALALSSGS